MKYYILAGEASGDLHAANLIKALQVKDAQSQMRGTGGDLMQSAGCELVLHYREMAFMGIVSVVANLKTIGKNFDLCKNDLLQWKPDVLILVDYPGFNLRMAKFAKEHGIKTVYYISPKIWAWKKSRIKQIKAYVDQMLTILPFETEFYKKLGYTVHYVGNPVLDAIELRRPELPDVETFRAQHGLDERPIVAILAGSRKQEINLCLPPMLKSASRFLDFQFVLAGASSLDREFYAPFLEGSKVTLVYDETYQLLNVADAAIVTSGTATLETALMNVPQVVVYKTQWFNYIVGSFIVFIRFFSLVNIIAGREVVKELLQRKLDKRISAEIAQILYDDEYKNEILTGYGEIRKKIGPAGAPQRAAEYIHSFIGKK
jgi:lipid-A-disaccharide synthase